MKNVKQGIQAPELSEEVQGQLSWLMDRYLDDLSKDLELRAGEQKADGTRAVSLSPEVVRQLTAAIDRQLPQLTRMEILAAELEKEQLDAKIEAAALPLRRLGLIARYVTSNDRELERSMKRLEVLQQVRRASGRIWPAKGA
jgi:hypothetical protein